MTENSTSPGGAPARAPRDHLYITPRKRRLSEYVEMFMKADVAHRFWLGRVNIAAALAKGEMRAKGPIPEILKMVPLAKTVFPRYTELREKIPVQAS